MVVDDADWAEAFALAEGNDTASPTNPSHQESPPSSSQIERSSKNAADDQPHQEEADPRIAPFLPPISQDQQSYYELQGRFDSTCCERYIPGSNDCCGNCQGPPVYHLMVTKNQKTITKKNPRRHKDPSEPLEKNRPSQLYTAIRNLRCFLRISPEKEPSSFVIQALQDRMAPLVKLPKPSSKKRKKYDSFVAWDAPLLQACQAMEHSILPSIGGSFSSKRKDETIVDAIKAIMACDAIYYRLYYYDLTVSKDSVIPHPVQYFGGGLLGSGTPTHALERLHQLRMDEGRYLFGLLETTQDDNLWLEWQDSCRDFLCHLYSYATVPSTSLEHLRKRLVGHSVMEVGAGTGYLARLIGNVDAFDSHPGTTDNEYHAATPPYMVVKSGGPNSITQHSCSALILCYPPVDNEMAYEALRIFLERSPLADDRPRLLVHIGEFQGLTGTPRFEALLLEKLFCIDTLPCLSWGSDAAAITLWELRSQHAEQPPPMTSLLVPCVRCNNRPATRRFRLYRSFAYCSMECAKQDSSVRRDVLPPCISTGLIPWSLQTDNSWQFLRVAPRPNSTAVLDEHS